MNEEFSKIVVSEEEDEEEAEKKRRKKRARQLPSSDALFLLTRRPRQLHEF